MNKTKTITFLSLGLLGSLLISGCSGTRESLGLNQKAPDEFSVVKRAPLAMPPSYNLRPPVPGAPRPQELQAAEQARQAVFGSSAQGDIQPPTSAEDLLLQQAGSSDIDPNIRQIVDKESVEYVDENKPVLDKLLGKESESELGEVINPKEEVERLKQQVSE